MQLHPQWGKQHPERGKGKEKPEQKQSPEVKL